VASCVQPDSWIECDLWIRWSTGQGTTFFTFPAYQLTDVLFRPTKFTILRCIYLYQVSDVKAALSAMRDNFFIDLSTDAIFIDMTVFNPSLDLVSVVRYSPAPLQLNAMLL
jgi:hypothetical protein